MRVHSPTEERAFEKRLTWIQRVTRLARHVPKRRVSRLANSLFYLDPRRPETSLKFIAPYHRGLLLHIDTNSWLERWILNQGCYERELVDFLDHYMKPGMVACDVGANIGCHTLIMAANAGPTGRIYAFEPHPAIHQRLQANVALNRLANVELQRTSLSDQPGHQTLFAPLDQEYNQGLASMHRDNLGHRCQEISVESLTLDEFVSDRNIERLDLLKVDVEGHEFQVLNGARDVLRELRPMLIIEFSERQWANAGVKPAEVESFLAGFDYDLFVLRDRFITRLEHGAPSECNLIAAPRPRTQRQPNEVIPVLREPVLTP